MNENSYSYAGSCGCGAVSFVYHCSLPLADQSARACQCEFCAPRQAHYLSDPSASLEVSVRDTRWLYAHRFGTGTADFMHCARCNTQVFVRCEVDGHHYGLVCAERLKEFHTVGTVEPVDYGTETLDDRLRRRAARWIGDLRVTESHAR